MISASESLSPTVKALNLPVLRVAFDDSPVLAPAISAVLKKYYEVVPDDKHPQIVFYGNFGWKHLQRKDCVKVFTSTECVAPDFNECDYAISCNRIEFNGRNLFLPPCFSLHLRDAAPTLPEITTDAAQRKFCSFLYSQRKEGEGSRLRAVFCERLMAEYAHVDCPGKVLHNMDAPELAGRFNTDWNASKLKFIGKYKFNIAFENSDSDGYMTEKLTDCFLAGTVPIYRGSEGNLAPFPKDAVICANDYADLDSLIARVKEVNENDEEYLRILSANPFYHGFSLSRQKEFEAFLLRVADVARCPKACDPVAHSDVAIWREMGTKKTVLVLVLMHLAVRFLLQKLRLNFLRGEQHDAIMVDSSRTKWLGNLVVNQLRNR